MATKAKYTLAVLAMCLLTVTVTEGMSLARIGMELRCQCIKTESRIIHSKHMQSVELIQSGPHCPNVEVIATLKTGRSVCLDPSAKWVERIIKRILERASLKTGQTVCLAPSAKWVERIIKRILERATLKTGRSVCLDPSAKRVERIIKRILQRATLKTGRSVCLDPSAKRVERIIKMILQRSKKKPSQKT